MRRLGWTGLLVATVVAAPVAAQTIDSHGIRSGDVRIAAGGIHTGTTETRSLSCSGGSLVGNGNNDHLTVSGCTRLTVAGNDNDVSIAFSRPGSLAVPGNRNTVTWNAPRDVRVDLSSLGTRNHVTRG